MKSGEKSAVNRKPPRDLLPYLIPVYRIGLLGRAVGTGKMGTSGTHGRPAQAILFADIHNYSRLMKKYEAQTLKRVDRAVRLIKSLAKDYGGQIKNVAGDGVLALFQSAPQSVRFAVEMQREFRTDAVWNSEHDPIAFRIGIN